MAASSSTAAHSNNSQWYEIFINHRGVDVKKTFAKSLYNRLRSIELKAFLDEDELQRGYEFPSQIKRAIETASAHVAIFSARYAESNWCLDELVQMLDSGVPTIPVFYGVTPAEVRWTRSKRGRYAQALQNLAEKRTSDPQTNEEKPRFDSKTIEDWRNALFRVADISGFELEACNIGKEVEMELLDKVVKCLSEIVKKPEFPVADYPTGLNFKLQDFEETVLLQQQQRGKSQILGIVGLGGVGKTTFAKHFFNMKKSDYHRSCFLFEVRDSAAKNSLNSLQRILLKNLTGLDKLIDNVDEGKEMLIEPLKSCNALVILDDVDDVNQVNALLPVCIDDLLSGSLILITSKDKDVLRRSRVENSSIYTLTGLNTQLSRELFCFHAFGQASPLPDFEPLVDKFLESCKGLPLSLKIFGALLYDKEISEWEVELKSLQQMLPSEILNTLRISYSSLNEEERQIFLDIACFFRGQNRDTAISLWNASGWSGRRGLQNLLDKSLVEVDSWNSLHMHDHLKNLGIDVGEKSSPRRLSRWTENVIIDLLQQSCAIPVRGLKMDLTEYNEDDDVLGAILMSRLQILDTEGSLLEHILKRVKLPKILWLRWMKCPYSTLPAFISTRNLRFFQVSGSVLNSLWQREDELQGSPQLPECLEELWADGCVNLKSVGDLVQLTKLRILHVSGCSELEELPNLETLVSLEELWADGCTQLKRIKGSATLTKVRQPTKLRLLHVGGCSQLQELPDMETFVSLEELWADRCVQLKSIKGSGPLTKLRLLHVGGCSELQKLPSMETVISLEELWADGCVELKRIRGSSPLTKLRLLHVGGCSKLEELPLLDALVALEELWADACVNLKSIKGSAPTTKLRWLHVGGCSQLEELPSMETLASVEELWADRCLQLKRLRGSSPPTKLRLLHVGGCSNLEELPTMDALVALEELWADGCVNLKSIKGSAPTTKLRWLHVGGCSQLEELPSMETLASLEELWADGCLQLKRLRGSSPPTKLRFLHVGGCSNLEELPTMDALVALEELWADACVNLKSIKGSAPTTKLRWLHVGGCSQLEELPSMETLASLEELWADRCVQLRRIRGSSPPTKLRLLHVGGCSKLEELPILDALGSLEELWADGCVKLRSIKGSAPLTKLRLLHVGGCSELEALPSMEALVSLEELWADGCVKLESVRGSAQPRKLRLLRVWRVL